MASTTRRLSMAIGTQGLANLLTIGSQLLSVSVLLRAWGTETYADWLLLVSLAGLLNLGELGLQGYLGNTLRSAWARGDWAAGQRVLSMGLGVHAVQAAILALAAVPLAALVAGQDGLGSLDSPGATFLLLALATLLLLPRGFLAMVHSARGNLARELAGVSLTVVSQTAAVLCVALAGGSPLQAAAAQLAAVVLVGWGALLLEIRRLYPGVSLAPAAPRREELAVLARKAPLYWLRTGCSVLTLHFPVILLGHLAPPAALVLFTTLRTFTGLVRQTAFQLGQALGWELARRHERGELDAVARLLHRVVPLLGLVVGGIAGVAWSVGPVVFDLWTHGRIPFDPLVAAVFLAGPVLQVPAYPAVGLLRLVDRPGTVARAQVAEVLAGFLAALALVPAVGALGAALAVMAAETFVLSTWLFRAAWQSLGRSAAGSVAQGYGAAALALALALLPGWALSAAYPGKGWDWLLAYGVSLAIVTGVCALVAWKVLGIPVGAWLARLRGGRPGA